MQKKLFLSSMFVIILSLGIITVMAQNGLLPFNVVPEENGNFEGNHQYPKIDGSIQVDENFAGDLSSLATVSQAEAETAAITYTTGGTVVSSDLDNENGFVVWKVVVSFESVNYEILIDAGNGSILVAEVAD